MLACEFVYVCVRACVCVDVCTLCVGSFNRACVRACVRACQLTIRVLIRAVGAHVHTHMHTHEHVHSASWSTKRKWEYTKRKEHIEGEELMGKKRQQ